MPKEISTLEQTLVDIINNSKGSITDGINFAQQQIPDVIQQLLMWNSITSAINFTIFILIVLLIIFLNYKQIVWFKEQNKLSRNDTSTIFNDYMAGAWLLNALQIAWLIPLTIFFDLTWVKIWVAPKLFLIEYIANLMK